MEVQPTTAAAQTIWNYIQEATAAKQKRMDLNRDNFDCYHLNADWTHKNKGQSMEFLNKQQMAVEQITSFLQQGLIDEKNWYDIEKESSAEMKAISEKDIKKLLSRQFERIGMPSFAADSIKMGLLGSLMICKVHGKNIKKSRFEIERKEKDLGGKVTLSRVDMNYWGLDLTIVRHEDYFVDPTGRSLYEIEAIDIDYHELVQIAEASPDVYNVDVVKALNNSSPLFEEEKKARETNQDPTIHSTRKMIRVYECWGTILDPTSKEIIKENCVCTITEDLKVIRDPQDNPNWHNESPYVVAPIIRVPKSVWHRAIMDGPTKHNKALNEIYNLIVDGGMMSVFGIKQLATKYLDDPTQIENGIAPGTTLLVNGQLPPGQKVMERVDTGTLGNEGFQVFQVMDREFQASSLTNDTRMGNLPQRAVKATEIVASNQTITGIFNGIVKMIETAYVEKVVRKATLTMCQNMNDLNAADIKDLLGPQEAAIIAAMEPEEIFATVANGAKFKVFGMSTVMNRINDFRKITSLLQTIATNPSLSNNFQKKYSFTKLLGEIIKSLDINEDKIMLDPQEKMQIAQEQAMAQKLALMAAQGGKAPKDSDQQSQIANVGDMPAENGMPNQQAEIQQGASAGD